MNAAHDTIAPPEHIQGDDLAETLQDALNHLEAATLATQNVLGDVEADLIVNAHDLARIAEQLRRARLDIALAMTYGKGR